MRVIDHFSVSRYFNFFYACLFLTFENVKYYNFIQRPFLRIKCVQTVWTNLTFTETCLTVDVIRGSNSIMTPHILVWLWVQKNFANKAIPSMTFWYFWSQKIKPEHPFYSFDLHWHGFDIQKALSYQLVLSIVYSKNCMPYMTLPYNPFIEWIS